MVVDEGYEVRGGVVRKVYRLGGETVAVREGSAVYAAVGDHLGSVTVLAQGGSPAGVTRYLPYGPFGLRPGFGPPTAASPGSGGWLPWGCMTTRPVSMIPRWAVSCSRIL